MTEWIKCDECGEQMNLFESHPIDPEDYPVDDFMRVCLDCYETFYYYYDQIRQD